MKLLILASAIFSVAVMAPVDEQRVANLRSNANALIDGVLAKASKGLPVYEKLGDLGTKLNLKACQLVGLNNGIHRYGNASMNFVNGSLHIDAGVFLNSIGIRCNWANGLLHGTLEASAWLPTITASVETGLSSTSHPKLDAFKVAYLGSFEIEITGAGAFDNAINKIAENELNGKMKPKIISTIETKLPPLIQKELDKIHV